MPEDRKTLTFVWPRDHQKYHADAQTIALLWAVRQWDTRPTHHVAELVFDTARRSGRVLDGPVHQHDLAKDLAYVPAARGHAIDTEL
jgi:hypothetical protein